MRGRRLAIIALLGGVPSLVIACLWYAGGMATLQVAVPRVMIPREAKRLSDDVYLSHLQSHWNGEAAMCGQLYGYDVTKITWSRSRAEKGSEGHYFERRDQVSEKWLKILSSMHEGEDVRAWVRRSDERWFREYTVFLARIDRLDQDGRAMTEEHGHLCAGAP